MNRRQVLLLALIPAALLGAIALIFFRVLQGTPPAVVAINTSISAPLAKQVNPAAQSMATVPTPENETALARLPSNLASLVSRMEQVAGMPDSAERERELVELVDAVPVSDIGTVVDYLAGAHPSDPGNDLFKRLIHRWVDLDAPEVASWVDSLSEGALRQATANRVGIQWANKDAPGVSQWIAHWPEGKAREEVVMNVGYEVARRNPKDAINLAVGLLPDGPMDDLVVYAVSQWAVTAPGEATAWAKKIENEPLRNRALGVVAVALAPSDPNTAANMAVDDLPPGRLQDDVVVSIVQRWTQSNPIEAANWVANFGVGPLRDAALQNFVSIWADKDPSGTAEWLEQLPPGGFRDAAIAAYMNKLRVASLGEAQRWAGKLKAHQLVQSP